MNKCFKKFQVKDFVFLAILSAAMTLCGGITMPLVMHTTLFGLRNMAAAPIYALFCAIGLMKVRKPGALTIIGLFSGAPLVFFSPVMFFNNFVAAIIAELLMLLFFRGYNKKGSVLFTAAACAPDSFNIYLARYCGARVHRRGNRHENSRRTAKGGQAQAQRRRRKCLMRSV